MAEKFILGVESSCDDTAAAVVAEDGRILSSVVASQNALHAPYGGVYPDVASRAHIMAIVPTIRAALSQAGVTKEQLAAIAVTRGPGLIGSLLVGLNAAAGLGAAWEMKVIGVNHLRGHLRSADLDEARIKPPAIVLLVSGGHSILARYDAADRITLLGSTKDDSAGEAYDKVARTLGLGYPGGPAIDRMALEGRPRIRFPRPLLNEGLDFSFSGLKTAVARHVSLHPEENKADIAASFVAACIDVLTGKCRAALHAHRPECLVVVGGVAASKQLRAALAVLCDEAGVTLSLPPLMWSTDNAAMIALAAWDYVRLGIYPKLQPEVRLPITEF
jgi:N6-L-threonylcarbamoyladenine synthase